MASKAAEQNRKKLMVFGLTPAKKADAANRATNMPKMATTATAKFSGFWKCIAGLSDFKFVTHALHGFYKAIA